MLSRKRQIINKQTYGKNQALFSSRIWKFHCCFCLKIAVKNTLDSYRHSSKAQDFSKTSWKGLCYFCEGISCAWYSTLPSSTILHPSFCSVPWEADLYGLHQLGFLPSGSAWCMPMGAPAGDSMTEQREVRPHLDAHDYCFPHILCVMISHSY